MALKMKKKDELDSLFADLGVLELPDGVILPNSETVSPSVSEDPYAKWLTPKSESLEEN
ncbi:MAG: hypothetical protein LBI13_03020 [Streptococcaceae bacterium]|jgi:hypothetical protein|nr:hypothetical protein [Streptococcaceae bacterium]